MNRWRVLLVSVLMAAALPAATFAAATPAGAVTSRLVPGQYPTIQAAIDASGTGDTVVVAPGVYTGGFTFAGKDVTVTGSGGPDVTTLDLEQVNGVDIGPAGTLSGFTVVNGRDRVGRDAR
jgi:pectin methylesterase-like acyl-CoA thioesterase